MAAAACPRLIWMWRKTWSVSNSQLAQGKTQSCSLRLRHLTTEPTIAERPKKFRVVSDGQSLSTFAQEKDGLDAERSKTFSSLFRANSRELQGVTILGLSKSDITVCVDDAVEKIKVNATPTFLPDVDVDFLDVDLTSQLGRRHLRNRI